MVKKTGNCAIFEFSTCKNKTTNYSIARATQFMHQLNEIKKTIIIFSLIRMHSKNK